MDAFAEIERLRAELGSHHRTVRRRAAIRLGTIKHPEAVSELLGLLQDPDAAVRAAAVAALGRVRDDRCREALERFLCESRPDSALAADALLSWGPEAIPSYLRALEGAATPVRIAAAEALGRLRSPAAVPALEATLRDPSEMLVDAALKALIRIADESALQALAVGLDGCRRSTKLEIVEILRKRRCKEAIPALCRQLDDPDEPVARRAGLALLEITVPEGLIRDLLKPLFSLRGVRLYADRRVIPSLLLALEHGGDRLRLGATRWLGHLAQNAPCTELRQAIPLLKRHLSLFSNTPKRERDTIQGVLRKIEDAVQEMADRPIPTHAPAPDGEGLPIPSGKDAMPDA